MHATWREGDIMSKRKRKEMAMSEPSRQRFITEFVTEKNKLPEIKLEIEDKKKIMLEYEDEGKDKN